MGQLWPLLYLVAGILLVAGGLLLVSRSLQQLRRSGAFSSLYWASFGRYAGYRLRSLRPLVGTLLGVAMVATGLGALYLGTVGFYAVRLGGVSG